MDEIARSADISRQGHVSTCLNEEGVELERRVVAALDAWLDKALADAIDLVVMGSRGRLRCRWRPSLSAESYAGR